MYQEAFKKLKPKEVDKILDIYNPLFEGTVFDPAQTTIMAQEMSFYPGMRYLDIADYSCMPPIHRFVVDGPGSNPTILDWSNTSIYYLNKTVPILLNEDTAPDYVRFFFGHVRGKNGRFLMIENVDDIRWREDPPPAARKSISNMLLPIGVTQIAADGSFVLSMTVMFKDSLFKCDANLSLQGTIQLENEELLVEDMPVLDDTFGQ